MQGIPGSEGIVIGGNMIGHGRKDDKSMEEGMHLEKKRGWKKST